MNYNRKLILENGEEYLGFGFGSDSDKICEIVFKSGNPLGPFLYLSGGCNDLSVNRKLRNGGRGL